MDGGVTWYDVKGDSADAAYTWDSKSVQTFLGAPGVFYRITGGSAGAIAYVFVAGLLDAEEGHLFGIVG